ncbi:Methyltransferase domain-containing protein [Loktanella sp. DSM 29012]|uniref:class I SAM-dependent methyltransferase n=1 Tax=Loktanella sp. DSM 29012 TaxID=1881056 RepID=UPI0008CA34DA|nr:class I SAM-dependent methyltransferase [Loktanella sp. DSM 29012]SEQ14602.1 Methyltransferase domain-containing protein [Loktanella sp. DSM 29012]
MVDDKTFWDRAADKYISDPIADMDAYEEGLCRTIPYLSKDMRAIEIGCGSGMTARRLAPHVGHLTATDLSSAMIGHARKLQDTENGPDNIDYRVADLAGFSHENADVVLCFSLLHLLPDLDAGLRQIHQILPAGGLFISKTPCLGGLWSALKLIMWPMKRLGKAPSNVHFFTAERLENRVRAAGFDIVAADVQPTRPPRHYIVARRI